MLADRLINVINSKGWLAIHDLFFDNSYNMRILGTQGFITMDKVNGEIYAISNIASSDSTIIHSGIIHSESKKIGQLGVISITHTDLLQRFQLATYQQKTEFMQTKVFPETPKYPVTNSVYTIYHDNPVLTDEYLRDATEDEILNGLDDNTEVLGTRQSPTGGKYIAVVNRKKHEQYYEIIEEIGIGINKEIVDNFYANQAAFKTLISAELGLKITDLI